MNYPLSGIRIDPQGQTAVVTFTDTHGNTATVYADNGGAATITLPDTITSTTAFYLPDNGPWTVSAKVSGIELAGQTITLEDEQVSSISLATTLTFDQLSGAYAPAAGYVAAAASGQLGYPANFNHWRKALANVRNGTGDAKLLCVGDSTTFGLGAQAPASPPSESYPKRLADMLNAYFAPAVVGLRVPPSGITPGTDSAWVAGTGWAVANPLGWGGGCDYQYTSGGGSLVFTPGTNADTYDVYWLGGGGLGTATITATGGVGSNINTSTTPGVYKTTVTASAASTANTVTIAPTGGGLHIVGVDARLSTKSQVRVGNAGVGSATTGTWIGQDGTGWGGGECIAAYAPDLTIICLGINDAGSSVTAATYQSNLEAIIAKAAASGDVILLTRPPTYASGYQTLEAAYETVDTGLASANGYGLIDLQSAWVSGAAAYAAGWISSDQIHPTLLGYTDEAQRVYNALTRI